MGASRRAASCFRSSIRPARLDEEVIRDALGDCKPTYRSFSYGTFLGETYAHLFPTHVRALALDAVVDPAVSAPDEIANTSGWVCVPAVGPDAATRHRADAGRKEDADKDPSNDRGACRVK